MTQETGTRDRPGSGDETRAAGSPRPGDSLLIVPVMEIRRPTMRRESDKIMVNIPTRNDPANGFGVSSRPDAARVLQRGEGGRAAFRQKLAA